MEIYLDKKETSLITNDIGNRNSKRKQRVALSNVNVNVTPREGGVMNDMSSRSSSSSNNNLMRRKGKASSYFMNKPALRVASSSYTSTINTVTVNTAINSAINTDTTTNDVSLRLGNNNKATAAVAITKTIVSVSEEEGVKNEQHTFTPKKPLASSISSSLSSDVLMLQKRKSLSPTFGMHLSRPASRLPARIDVPICDISVSTSVAAARSVHGAARGVSNIQHNKVCSFIVKCAWIYYVLMCFIFIHFYLFTVL